MEESWSFFVSWSFLGGACLYSKILGLALTLF